jgi:UDP-N-acetylglucosamine--N-acetylmuramyl-(pentapeptide) pyrophosphoryl-undecaprenol N-acetylglucosamine transferase
MLFFFASPIGLGHSTRDIAIADKLQNRGRKKGLLFISGEGAARLIEKKGYKVLDAYKPEKFIVQDGQLQHSLRWLMSYYSYYKKCKQIAKDVLAHHQGNEDEYDDNSNDNDSSGDDSTSSSADAYHHDDGDLVVSDEDFASISVAQEAKRTRILITDITETHFTKGAASLIEKKMNGAMKEMIRKCDQVIIPDFGQDHDNISYVGPIVREATAGRDALRKHFNFTKRTIVVSVGGTDAGRYLIEKSLDAFRKLRSKMDSDLVIVPGPSIQLPESSDYRNLGFVDNLHEVIYAADLVISLAGRSTMDESIVYGTPGIFIPIKGHFEQEQGAARLGYKHEDIFRLESLIEEKLGSGKNQSNNNNITATPYDGNGVNAGGAEKAAKIISSIWQ